MLEACLSIRSQRGNHAWMHWHQAGLAKLGSSYGQHARCQVNIDISQSERFSYAQSG